MPNKSCEECAVQDGIQAKVDAPAFVSEPGRGSAYPTLILALISLSIIVKGRQKWFKKRAKGEGRSSSEIVRLQQYPHVKLPPLMDGLVGTYNVKKYGIRVMGMWWKSVDYVPFARIALPFHEPAICVMEPELIKKVLGSADMRCLNKPKIIYDVMFPKMLIDGLLASRVDIWQPHRKILNRCFTYSSLHGHLKVLNKYGKALSTSLRAKGNEGNVDEPFLSSTLYEQLLKVILEVLMGPDNVSRNGTTQFVENFREVKPLLVYRLLHPLNLIPPVWWLNPTSRVFEKAITKTDAYYLKGIDETTKQEEVDRESGETSGDSEEHGLNFIQYMLRSKFSRTEINSEIATLLMAGHETTYGALGFLLQHLAEHPEIQKQCQEEVDLIFGDEEQELSMEDLTNLKYLERCISESLRLSPTVPLVSRQLAGGLEFEGFYLEKDTIMVFPSWLVHRNPNIYPDPERFDPDRFLPEAVKARHPYAYLPFSMGPRNCIGWKLAMMEMKTMMAYLLRDYHVETTDKFSQVKLEFEVTLVPERNFNTTLKRREMKNL